MKKESAMAHPSIRRWQCVPTSFPYVCFCRSLFMFLESIMPGTCNKKRCFFVNMSEVPVRRPVPESREHHLCISGSLMWLALWRTDTLLLFTVPGALQGILGPEGKPVPGFMRGMSLPQILWWPQCVSFSYFVGKFSERKVWEECEVTPSALQRYSLLGGIKAV